MYVWSNLNAAEKEFAKKHPKAAADFYLDSIAAEWEKERIWKGQSFRSDTGPENAFKHAYWNALMAFEHGEALAKEAADAHEADPGNDPAERSMDYFNNDVGRKIGVGFPSKFIGSSVISDTVYRACITQRQCMSLTKPPPGSIGN